ncbi:MAG: haloacid dehalogenase type II [Thermomicrobiales bacterium]
MAAIGFDVYGTLVDPLAMSGALEPVAGERAGEMATVWRTKQLEYSFRRALMGAYKNFDVCTRDALRYAARATGIDLGDDEERRLIDAYLDLEPYPDVISGIDALQRQGHALVAFSNGVESSLRALLSRSGVLEHLDGIVSVDGIQTFKPDPAVYEFLAEQLESPREETWLVSSNYWDVIGARQAGLHAAWLRRDPASLPDPWGIEPDVVIGTIEELAAHFR